VKRLESTPRDTTGQFSKIRKFSAFRLTWTPTNAVVTRGRRNMINAEWRSEKPELKRHTAGIISITNAPDAIIHTKSDP
jgi:hypothetical protein